METLPDRLRFALFAVLIVSAFLVTRAEPLDESCVSMGEVAAKPNPIDGLYVPRDVQPPKTLWKCDGGQLER